MLDIRIQAIILSDDGKPPGNPAVGSSWSKYVDKLIGDANRIYEDQGIGFRLRFNPDTDVTFKKSTLLNRFQPKQKLDQDPNGNDINPNSVARQQECWKYPGRVVMMWRDYQSWEDQSAHSTGLYGDYVYFNKAADDTGITVAHELGHAFGLDHTHDKDNGVATVKDAIDAIKAFVKNGGSIDKGLDVFNYDLANVKDTPADAGPALISSENKAATTPPPPVPVGGYRCGTIGSVDLVVKFKVGESTKKKKYVLRPDRSNFMSYFMPCQNIGGPNKPTISPDQKSVIEAALETGQRNSLLHTAGMVDGEKAHFFKPGRHLQYDISSDRVDTGFPKSIDVRWPGLPWSHIDAAAQWPDGSTYFFHNDEYVKYDRINKRVFKNYPQKIGKWWKGVWDSDIDAVLVLNNENAVFFKGSKCINFDIPHDKGAGIQNALNINDRFGGVFDTGIDAALRWSNDKVYFFKGDRYARYDLATHRTDQDIHQIRGNWPGLWTSVDAAVVWNDGSVRFLKGGKYLAYSVLGDEAMEGYPRSLAKSDWNSWDGDFPWTGGFDAGSVWDNDRAYLFKGGKCVRFNLKKKSMDQGPRAIGEEFKGVGNGELDAVVRWDDGKAYFFSGQHYIQVDVATRKAISDRLDISTFWRGIPSTRFDAVIAMWNLGKVYFFKDKNYWRYDIKADRADQGYPTGITAGGWPGWDWS